MTTKEQQWFDVFAVDRAKKPLKTGQRWLTCDDVWQLGDEYDGGSGWWSIGGPYTSVRAGSEVAHGMICYTPRGKR